MTITAKLFMSGCSQAIRLPAGLRLQAQEVRIEQIGKALWVQAETATNDNMGKWQEDFYATTDALSTDFLAARNDALPQERNWA